MFEEKLLADRWSIVANMPTTLWRNCIIDHVNTTTMSEHGKNSISSLQGIEGFKPLSEEEERQISGGESQMMPPRCKDDEYLDPGTGQCVKRSQSPASPAS